MTPWLRPDAAAVDGEFQGIETQATTTSTERDPADAGALDTNVPAQLMANARQDAKTRW